MPYFQHVSRFKAVARVVPILLDLEVEDTATAIDLSCSQRPKYREENRGNEQLK